MSDFPGNKKERISTLDSLMELLLRSPGREFFLRTAPLVLAVSGGRDSMLLLYLFGAMNRRGMLGSAPVVYHLHHGLREEAEQDLSLVRREAAKWDLPFYYEYGRVDDFARRSGLGLEAAGRRLRYRGLGRILRRWPRSRAVTAHHADDYLESLLIHLIRGGGAGAFGTLPLLGSAEGIPLLRPLMLLSREEVDLLVQNESIPFLEDASNASGTFLRNRLRRDVVPLLRREGIDPVRIWWNFHTLPEERTLPPLKKRADRIDLDRTLLSGAGRAELKELLDLAFRKLGLSPVRSTLVEEVLRQGGEGGSLRIHYESPDALLWAAEEGPLRIIRKDSSLFRKGEGVKREDGRVEIRYGGRSRIYRLGTDEEAGEFRPGDVHFLETGGTGDGKKKKIKKLFQELRLPPPVRANLPLIRNRKSGVVVRLCLSLWEGGRDLTFPPSSGELGRNLNMEKRSGGSDLSPEKGEEI